MTESGSPENSINTSAGGPTGELTAEQLLRYVGIAALYLITLVAYLPAIRANFIWDDDDYVLANRSLRSFDGLRTIWLGIADPQAYRDEVIPQYYPMTVTSFWLEYRFWGASAIGYHLVNVLLHATSALLLWTILRKLALPGAWAVAAIWAIHPINVESVAWITERKNVLSGVFYFCSLLIWMRFSGLDPAPQLAPGKNPLLPTERWKLYLLALFLFVCALLSKSVTGSLPAVMLLLLWWKRGRIDWKNDVLPLLPFFALAIGMGAVTTYMEHNVVGAQGEDWSYTSFQRCLIAGRAVWFYAYKLIWPASLIFMYDKWDVALPQQSWQVLFGAALIGAVVALFSLRSRIGRGPVVAVLIFAGTLFPALGFVNVFPLRYAFVADHFQYLASIALIALVVVGAHRLIKLREARVGAAAVVMVIFCVLTFRQCRIYKDAVTLWMDTIERNPNSWMARNNLGTLYLLAGNEKAALDQFARVHALRPRHMEAVMNIGIIAERRGQYDVALHDYFEAIKLCQHDTAHRAICAEPYMHLGVLYSKLGKFDDAVAAYEKAIEWNPRHAPAMTNLGVIYADRKNYDKAIELYTRSLMIDPDSVPTRTNFANALLAQGDLREAAAQWEEIQRLDPNNANVRNAIGGALLHMGEFDQAINMFKRAIELKPDFEEAKKNLDLAQRLKQAAATQPATTRAVPTTAPAADTTRPR